MNRLTRPIAIIGGACRFPGASGFGDVARILGEGQDMVREDLARRWVHERLLHPRPRTPGYSYTFAAAHIDNVEHFDPELFGISPREAVQMDPQQHLLLELSHEALEDAGIAARERAARQVGVYVAISFSDHMNRRSADLATADGYLATGGAVSICANRISHAFDFHGPSLVVDTACSSSLVALHLACRALRAGEIDTAIVGGANLLLDPRPFIGFAQAMMLSPTGRCRPFSNEADGFLRAEGSAVLVLRRHDRLEAHDRPRAWILGSGVNSDGRTLGVILPNGAAQAALLRQVYAEAGVAPDALSYFEAHGTGTAVGDPIEAAAIGEAISSQRREVLPVGSAKSSFGHLETASGMTGLFAAMTVLEHRRLPKLAHFKGPNPVIDFGALRLAPCVEGGTLAESGRLIVGINSFGFGGTNAHVVLSDEPGILLRRQRRAGHAASAQPPLLLSARSPAALGALADAWADHLEQVPAALLAPTLRGAARGRTLYPHRLVARGVGATALATALRGWRAGEKRSDVTVGQAVEGGIAFVFAGNGSQWAGMGQLALRRNAAFRNAIRRLDALLSPRLSWSVEAEMAAANPERLRRTDIAQPLLFALQFGLVEALRAAGIRPDVTLGHSVGEIAAAWTAGALDLDTALEVLICRSHLQHRSQGEGRMAACAMDGQVAQAIFAEHGLELDVAAYNAEASITISGRAAQLTKFGRIAEARGLFFRQLDLDYAFHSRLLDPIEGELGTRLAKISWREPSTALISSVTGAAAEHLALDAGYWWRNLRAPVRFAEAARALAERDVGLIVEIGPHPVLLPYLAEIRDQGGRLRQLVPSFSRTQEEGDPVAQVIAACHVGGADITSAASFDGARMARGLPHYAYQRNSVALAPSVESLDYGKTARVHPLLGFPMGEAHVEWRAHLDLTLEAWLADHKVDGEIYVPAAALIDMAFAAALARFPEADGLEILDMEITRPLVLLPDQMREAVFRVEPERGRFEIASRPRLADVAWMVHATGRIAPLETPPPVREAAGAGRLVLAEALYAHASFLGLNYGPGFRRAVSILVEDEHHALVRLAPPEPALGQRAALGVLLDPAWTDAAFHGMLALPLAAEEKRLPSQMGRIRLFQPYQRAPAEARIVITREGPNAAAGHIVIFDAAGEAVAEMLDCWFVRPASRQRDQRPGLWTRALLPLPHRTNAALPAPPDEQEMTAASDDAALLVEACLAAAAHAAVLPLAEDGGITPPVAVLAGHVAPESEGRLVEMLDLARDGGFATRAGESWLPLAAEEVPDWREIWRSLTAELPQAAGELVLLGAALDDLPRTLRGGTPKPMAGGRDLLRQVLMDGPDGSALIADLAARLVRIASMLPPQRSLHILETGPCAGVLTGALRRGLISVPMGLVVTIAVPDAEAADAAQTALGALPGRVLTWNLAEPRPPTLSEGGFDIVIGAYLGLLGPSATSLAQAMALLLAPGGRIMLGEAAPTALWAMLAQGKASDDTARWREALAAAGFGAPRLTSRARVLWSASIVEAEIAATWLTPKALRDGPVLLAASPEDAWAERLAARLAAAGSVVRRVALAELAGAISAETREVLLLPGETADLASCLACIAAAAGPLGAGSARLALVTVGEAEGEPVAAAIEGVVRVLGNETKHLTWRILRLSRSFDAAAAAEEILTGLGDETPEVEQILAPGSRRAPRLRPLGIWPAAGPARLAIRRRGRLDSLRWEPMPMPQPGAGELVLKSEAVGLNFRDLMWSLGLLPDEALIDGFAGPTLGLECAGTVIAIGEGVTRFALGERVVALAPASLATHVRTVEAACIRLPEGLDFAAAATLPVAFLTVCYGLGTLAQLAPGETVLIHAAAGGVGLAAVQYALHRGARVIATAGSPVKRALLRLLGVEHVLDSRSLAFADAALRLTGGRGVDVVLNSVSGKAMERSLEIVAPLGRFVELGKRDFFAGTAIGLRPLRRNVAYFGVDLDLLAAQSPERLAALFGEVEAMLKTGAIRPLLHRTMGYDAVEDAFQVMRNAGHVGKLVLQHARGAPKPEGTPPRFAADPDGVHVITGGLEGFGLETALWLVARGARRLALLGRRGMQTPGAAEAIAALGALGCEARAYACDVADRNALAATLTQVRARQARICGVVHAAMVLQDGMLAGMDEAAFRASLAPKYLGAVNLDALTADDPVSLFLIYSSVSTLLANPGQANYVAANAAIEDIAARRRAQGRHGLAVAWGPIGDAGVLTRHGEAARIVVRRMGSHLLEAQAALDGLDRMLAENTALVAAATIRWSDARATLRGLATPRYAEVLGQIVAETSAEERDLKTLVATLPPDQAHALVQARLMELISGVIGVPAASITPATRFAEIGLDSLMGVELQLAIEERLGASLPMSVVAEQGSIARLTEAVMRALGGEARVEESVLDTASRRLEGGAAAEALSDAAAE